MPIPSEYAVLLKTKGIYIRPGESQEKGLEAEPALIAIAILRENNIPVLGGDLYYNDGNEIKPTYDNWHCNIITSESLESFVERSYFRARDYIQRHYKGTANGLIFVLVPKDKIP